MTFTDLLTNIQAMANQCPSRVRTLRSGICLIGRGAEAWDEKHNRWRLPTADELMVQVIKSVGRRPHEHPWTQRRMFYQSEARKLVHFTRQVARYIRRENQDLL